MYRSLVFDIKDHLKINIVFTTLNCVIAQKFQVATIFSINATKVETDAKKSRLVFLAAVTTKMVESYFDNL